MRYVNGRRTLHYIGNGQPREPALYRHTFVRYSKKLHGNVKQGTKFKQEKYSENRHNQSINQSINTLIQVDKPQRDEVK